MSYTIYTTKGFVISSENIGESDKNFFIYTKELGLLRARASGVRKLTSKLRFILSDFSFCEISFVVGNHGWKIVNATPLHVFSNKISRSESKVRILRLLKRVCPQDEPDKILFDDLFSAFSFLDQNNQKENKNLEILVLMKMFSRLGYWANHGDFDFTQSSFDENVLHVISKNQKEIIKELNKSLRATQLV